ncbi:Pkr1-domain-containing protein [Lepidopterella palustris CBS 459.81]|uniref:Pkr1-domain-containing protein n=1 Tax=Lepidopterella palustris CBS 459.81 TaxID=1314670 RepID=A0A8E2ECM5_9PEZI|nr:Pkr1-domain-containing protein [Lepidopterella palustris CBS 459.81]
MATFIENLWNSIFTPGPTPTLLIATNASFAALQVLLLVLLYATYSVHFVVLSGLTAGLWWAINWFAGELRAAQEKEEEAKRIRGVRREKDKPESEGEGMDTGDDTEVDTEVEEKYKPVPKGARLPAGAVQSSGPEEKPAPIPQEHAEERKKSPTPMQSSSGPAGASTTSASTTGVTTRQEHLVDDALKKRRSAGDSTGEMSTDSEWEKVSEEGERK